MNSYELYQRQSLPLEAKINFSLQRIREWYEYFSGNVFVSFSGGKDSTVLLHLVRSIYPEVPAVFVNTGLEYPEIVRFVRATPNVVQLRPAMSFKQVLEQYGYPVVSKRQAQYIREVRNANKDTVAQRRLNGSNYRTISYKWRFLLDAPFKISEKCCDIMKKQPIDRYVRKTQQAPIIGTMASDSKQRELFYLKNGCNIFTGKHRKSMPLSIWTEQDIWDYIDLYKVPYSPIYDMGYSRTGCMFCMFGVHLENPPNRFQKMKETHPKHWRYCIEDLGIGKVLDYIGVEYH